MKKFAEIWDEVKNKEKYKNQYIKENNENMSSRKRTVKYSENTDPVDGDKNVEVSQTEEQSVSEPEQEEQPSSTTEEENTNSDSDERYTASAG